MSRTQTEVARPAKSSSLQDIRGARMIVSGDGWTKKRLYIKIHEIQLRVPFPALLKMLDKIGAAKSVEGSLDEDWLSLYWLRSIHWKSPRSALKYEYRNILTKLSGR